jgi:hypothetical protein
MPRRSTTCESGAREIIVGAGKLDWEAVGRRRVEPINSSSKAGLRRGAETGDHVVALPARAAACGTHANEQEEIRE